MVAKRAMAIGCHPDDIEFMMAGTLLLLKECGYEIHYMNVANGCLGSDTMDREETAKVRRREARNACELIGAVFHESLCDDLEVFYNSSLLEPMVDKMREVQPEIILTHGPYDYMEDHVNTGRLAVSAAFCRGMRNFKNQQRAPFGGEVAVYHSMPHSITDMLRRPVSPDMFVNIGSQMDLKRDMLACHCSQKEWLDLTQGNDAYLDDLTGKARYYGQESGVFDFAEGWIRHSHVGFAAEEFDPLVSALGEKVHQV